jgi:hypothetical protein
MVSFDEAEHFLYNSCFDGVRLQHETPFGFFPEKRSPSPESALARSCRTASVWAGRQQWPRSALRSGDCIAPGVSKSEIAHRLRVGRLLVRRVLAAYSFQK